MIECRYHAGERLLERFYGTNNYKKHQVLKAVKLIENSLKGRDSLPDSRISIDDFPNVKFLIRDNKVITVTKEK